MHKYFLILSMLWPRIVWPWDLPDVGTFQFEKINAQVYVMHGPLQLPNLKNQGFMNNPSAVITEKSVILIDPGSTYQVGKKVLEELSRITNKPIFAVFNTHVHGDHWLGNQAIAEKYPNVQIYASSKMIERAKNGEGNNWVKLMLSFTEGASKGTRAVYPKIGINNADKLIVAGETFIIHSVPKAHTDTDIMIEHVGSKTLFTGDNSFNSRLGRFDDTASIYGNIEVLSKINTSKLEYFVPGHGKSGNFAEAVEPFLKYMQILKKEVKLGYNQGLADYEIKKSMRDKMKDYENWSGFEDNFGRHISKMYLEVEERDL